MAVGTPPGDGDGIATSLAGASADATGSVDAGAPSDSAEPGRAQPAVTTPTAAMARIRAGRFMCDIGSSDDLMLVQVPSPSTRRIG
jgi:hypothetical protein